MADVTVGRPADARGQRRRRSPATWPAAAQSELVDAFADAAGVPTVVAAPSSSPPGAAPPSATGWPVTAWLAGSSPTRCKRLHLDLGAGGKELTAAARASVPEATQVQRARVDTAVRAVADDVGAELTPPWADAVRRASVSRLPDLNDALDKAVAGTDLGVVPHAALVAAGPGAPVGARARRAGRRAVAGGARGARLPPDAAARRRRTTLRPAAAHAAAARRGRRSGSLLGLVVQGGSCGLSARGKARSADRRLRAAIGEVTERLVVEPVEAEVEAYRATRSGLAAAAALTGRVPRPQAAGRRSSVHQVAAVRAPASPSVRRRAACPSYSTPTTAEEPTP